MSTIKVSEATNTQLDWLVAKAMGHTLAIGDFGTFIPWTKKMAPVWQGRSYRPSTDWSQMGPIIEREGINLSVHYQDDALSNDMVQIGWNGNRWDSSVPGTSGFLQWAYGPTPLIAAARCYVVSKLGDTVEVPDEL